MSYIGLEQPPGFVPDYAVGASSQVNNNIVAFSGTSGKVLADSGKSLPAGSVVGTTDTQTLTGKTINIANNTLTGVAPLAQPTFTGVPAAPTAAAGTNTTQLATTAHVFAERSNTVTLTNKTVNLANNTLTGTLAQFNTAVSDADFASLAGTETLSNKTLTTPVLSGSINLVAGQIGYTAGKLQYQDGTSTFDIGFRNIPQNSQSDSYILVLTDAGKHILHPSADTTSRTFTIPANSSVAFPIGTAITFVNQNAAGIVTIAITTDTMRLAGAGTTGSRTLAANGVATAIKLTSTEWIISGTGLT